jgi:hypothetical protein
MAISLEKLVHFDHLDPAGKLELLAGAGRGNPNAFLHECQRIVVVMHALDEVLRRRAGNGYFYYFQGDQSLITLFERIDAPLAMHDKAFAALGLSQHLYRFNVAKKFSLPEDVKQLRLNSWGREYIANVGLLDIHASLRLAAGDWFESYIERNKDIYLELLRILVTPMDANSSGRIRDMNADLDVKLLS